MTYAKSFKVHLRGIQFIKTPIVPDVMLYNTIFVLKMCFFFSKKIINSVVIEIQNAFLLLFFFFFFFAIFFYFYFCLVFGQSTKSVSLVLEQNRFTDKTFGC